MTIIDTLKKDYDQYLNHCLDVLDVKIDLLHLDYSSGETDFVRLVFMEKNGFTKYHAVAILTMRLLMYKEEWNDLKSYKKEDFERWTGFLEKEYQTCMYFPNIEIDDFKSDYFVQRLTTKKGMKTVELNAQIIDFLTFKHTNPLFHEQIISVSKTVFEGLREEFYIETTHHFVLLNWFTTA